MRREESKHRESQRILEHFTTITASTSWQCIDDIKLAFRTYHPQGLVKIGDRLYISSVEIVASPEKFAHPKDGYDRSVGEGIGYLFQCDLTGKLLNTLVLGEGSIYHPGGIDYDGESIWVPVAEYRPNSQSIIYRVNPHTLDSEEAFRFHDHIGGLACNRWNGGLHGVSWGSRAFYTWNPAGQNCQRQLNGSHYIDYQDCHFLEEKSMLCSGLSAYRLPKAGGVALGGLDVIDLDSFVAVHQVPVPLYSVTGRPMTQNPFFVELRQEQVCFYFIPDDDESTLYIYHAVV